MSSECRSSECRSFECRSSECFLSCGLAHIGDYKLSELAKRNKPSVMQLTVKAFCSEKEHNCTRH